MVVQWPPAVGPCKREHIPMMPRRGQCGDDDGGDGMFLGSYRQYTELGVVAKMLQPLVGNDSPLDDVDITVTVKQLVVKHAIWDPL